MTADTVGGILWLNMFSDSKREDNMELGARLRAARRERRITLEALARASGLTKGFLSQVESGNSGVSLASLQRISAALDVPLASLMASGEAPAPAPLVEAGRAHEPALIAARSLYQETTGLAQLAGPQTGTHFLALLPPNSTLSSQLNLRRDRSSDGILIMLQGSVTLRHASVELHVSAGEVASWDAAQQYSVENRGTSLARALVFIPDGSPVPALAKLPNSYWPAGPGAYSSLSQGPMRLVEMRARRQAERRR